MLRSVYGQARCCVVAFALLLSLSAQAADPGRVELQGHVLSALATSAPKNAAAESAPLTLTLVLQRSDEAGFERYLADVYDPASPLFRQFMSPVQISDRFGPSLADYAAVKQYFSAAGFAIADESPNRLTVTISGTRGAARRALAVDVADFERDERRFFANTDAPSLPPAIAAKVRAITGLSNLGLPERKRTFVDGPGAVGGNFNAIRRAFCSVDVGLRNIGADWDNIGPWFQNIWVAYDHAIGGTAPIVPFKPKWKCTVDGTAVVDNSPGGQGNGSSSKLALGEAPAGTDWTTVNGGGQRIGLVEFDRFDRADVADYLAWLGLPAALLDNVSEVHVAGGATPGPDAAEVLIDIDFVLPLAPGADVVVYDAPFTGAGTFQALFNRMVNDGMTVISNSWSYCEDQTTQADVDGIDAVLASAAASGVGVFNAAGDSGSTCLDGSANTVGVPASSPHATAVGGASYEPGPLRLYGTATWWDASGDSPRGGQGGFGTSRFFARPLYQNGFTASAMRSVPDVVTNADPANGIQICQAAAGGCPSGPIYAGTSMAAPAWAAYAALLNQAHGTNLGFLNPGLYPLGGTNAFHAPAELASDFAHVGLGSPNVNALHVALSSAVLGPTDPDYSLLLPSVHVADEDFILRAGIPADGTTPFYVVAVLRDANGNTLAGKTVTLSAGAGSHAVITPASAVTTAANGAAMFKVTDTVIEDLHFSAFVAGDNVTLTTPYATSFAAPSAASAGIIAFPTTVAADGVATTTITVTLRDAQNHPTPGKEIALAQNGRAITTGPAPPVTDANGEIVFTATDAFEEIVTWTAIDVTDGDLPVPGTAVVTFSGSAAGSCVVPPSAADGYTLTSWANGFAAYPFFYGNTNFGCSGATDPAFDAHGHAFVVHFPTGSLYEFGLEGGSATAPFATDLGPALRAVVFGRDGRMYGAHNSTTGDFFTGDIVEIDPATGTIMRQIATNLTCPGGLAIDPLSGDLFFTDLCFGAGSDNPGLFRLTDPGDTDPTRPTEVTTYATLPRTPNGQVAFAPNGTIYVETGYLDAAPAVLAVTGTDQAQPATYAPVAGVPSIFWVNVGAALPDGSARSLIVLQPAPPGGSGSDLNLVDITTDPPQVTTLAHDIGSGTIGPDGCLYAALQDGVYRIAPESGVCDFATTNPSPALDLSPRTIAPNPVQGSAITLTATFRNIAAPAGTPVHFEIEGANRDTRLARTDANGTAMLEYAGVFAGGDSIVAHANVDGVELSSTSTRVTWDAGVHSTFLQIVATTGAAAGIPATVSASLVDYSVDPAIALAGAPVSFAVAGQSCSASTNATGVAACSLTLATPGAYTLTASYAGSSQFLAASASALFVVPTDGIDLIFEDGFDGD